MNPRFYCFSQHFRKCSKFLVNCTQFQDLCSLVRITAFHLFTDIWLIGLDVL